MQQVSPSSPRRSDPSPGAQPTSRAVTEFYDRLVFPSRGSHPAYASLLPTETGQRIGEFGCGQSLFYDALRPYTPRPVFLDVSMNALRTIDYGFRVQADLTNLPFRNGHFDRILCIGVLHHLEDRGPALSEMARVLRPRGRLFIGVYAPRSLQSVLRRLHDASRLGAWRRAIFASTAFLIDARYRASGRPLVADDARRRASDLLEVPFVRYAPPEEYVKQASLHGLEQVEISRIAGMNILHLERAA